MTEHLPECPLLKPCCDDEEFPEHGFCGNFVGRCLHCMAECICDELRACEKRVREDERSSNFTPDDHSDGMTEAYQRGLDAAREAVLGAKAVDVANGREWDEPAQFIWLNHALAAIDALREELHD